jgi:flagellar biosynthetic protein FliP
MEEYRKLNARRKLKIIGVISIIICLVIIVSGCSVLTGQTSSTSSPNQSATAAAGSQRPTSSGGNATLSQPTLSSGSTTKDQGADPLSQLLGSRSASLQIVGLLTILSIAPAILIMLTGFTRIIIVLSITRNALGLQQMPPNQVLVALALFITFFVMAPVFNQIETQAVDPYMNQQITAQQAIDIAKKPIEEFMLKQTYKSDMDLFVGISKQESVSNVEDLPLSTVIPAYITSEIKRGFQMGFFIYIPFIVIDMVVASTLMAMGMMMLPPTMISLPFKVLLFVLVDGWALTIQTLISSFNT